MNKESRTLYMRNQTLDGWKLTDLLPAEKIAKVYPRDGKPARSIDDSVFLGPAHGQEAVRLRLERADLEPLFDSFFAAPAAAPVPAPIPAPATSSAASLGARREPIDAEAFEALMERRSDVGQAGELWAVQDELRRLERLGCPDPHRWVERVALTDVGRGYDIASTWPGHERWIEVKSSTFRSGALYVTENERQLLGELGHRAWLYRVWIRPDGSAEVVARVQDPMSHVPTSALVPVLYRVDASALVSSCVTDSERVTACATAASTRTGPLK